jgi:GNAT superfamily N-acetyltransferase
MNAPITLQEMQASDPPVLAAASAARGWDKPLSQCARYWRESQAGSRLILVARCEGEFAGYVTVVWESDYPPFRDAGIPEISDFNVLLKFRRRKIGSALMDEAERRISSRSPVAGLGVGLLADYGPAQSMYARRGYVPDGRGISYNGHYPGYGELVRVDDGLCLYLTRKVR